MTLNVLNVLIDALSERYQELNNVKIFLIPTEGAS